MSLSLASFLAWDLWELWEPLPSLPSLLSLPPSIRRSANVVGRAGESLEVGRRRRSGEGEEEHLEQSTEQVEERAGSFRYILRSIVE